MVALTGRRRRNRRVDGKSHRDPGSLEHHEIVAVVEEDAGVGTQAHPGVHVGVVAGRRDPEGHDALPDHRVDENVRPVDDLDTEAIARLDAVGGDADTAHGRGEHGVHQHFALDCRPLRRVHPSMRDLEGHTARSGSNDNCSRIGAGRSCIHGRRLGSRERSGEAERGDSRKDNRLLHW